LGGEALAGALHPALGEALAAADVIVPLGIALFLVAAVLAGSDKTVERVFRLLRWAANRPEPTTPKPIQQPGSQETKGTPADGLGVISAGASDDGKVGGDPPRLPT
jgi:hypothetical protein